MSSVSFEHILSDLKNKNYLPVYFLEGEEPYYIDAISDYIEDHVLDESEKNFNQTILYGKETEIDSILENAKRFPMMSERQVVIVKEAQNIHNIEKLSSYVSSPLNSTLLVICYKGKTIDKRKKEGKALAQALEKKGVLFQGKKLYENQLPDWISQYVKSKGYTIQPKASILLSEFLGNDLGRIIKELEKLEALINKGQEITADIIERNVGISKEFNNFELVKAIGKRDVLKSFQIADYFAKNPTKNPLLITLITLYGFFSKLILFHYLSDKSRANIASTLKVSPFFVSEYQTGASNFTIKKVVQIIGYLREYDKKTKGMNNPSTENGELLKELLYKVFN